MNENTFTYNIKTQIHIQPSNKRTFFIKILDIFSTIILIIVIAKFLMGSSQLVMLSSLFLVSITLYWYKTRPGNCIQDILIDAQVTLTNDYINISYQEISYKKSPKNNGNVFINTHLLNSIEFDDNFLIFKGKIDCSFLWNNTNETTEVYPLFIKKEDANELIKCIEKITGKHVIGYYHI